MNIVLIIWLIGAIIAFAMSWSCSSLTNRSLSTKLWWAFVSSLSSWSYVLFNYWIMNWDTCNAQGIMRAYSGCVNVGKCT